MGCGQVVATVVHNPLAADAQTDTQQYQGLGQTRGTATATAPAKGNGYRGELLLSDPFPGAEVCRILADALCP
jgi:hypothetical protein